MVFRMVAGDTPNPDRCDNVREPAGSAGSTYVRMTASRTWRSRFVSSSGAISPKLSTTSKQCQVCGQRVQPQPPFGREDELLTRFERRPTRLDPAPDMGFFACIDRQSVRRPETQV